MTYRSGVVDRVEREVFGEPCGSEGYLTAAEARALVRGLRLRAGHLVLDLGAGRGWPGRRIAEITGCDVLLADLPRHELVDALAPARGSDLAHRCSAVVAHGAALPFRARSFDAIVHADVMC